MDADEGAKEDDADGSAEQQPYLGVDEDEAEAAAAGTSRGKRPRSGLKQWRPFASRHPSDQDATNSENDDAVSLKLRSKRSRQTSADSDIISLIEADDARSHAVTAAAEARASFIIASANARHAAQLQQDKELQERGLQVQENNTNAFMAIANAIASIAGNLSKP